MADFNEIKAAATANVGAVEAKFPALADLARRHESSLSAQIEAATDHKEALKFSDCCLLEAVGFPHWGHCDFAGYLATFERMVAILLPMGADSKKLWAKIKNPSEEKFLDAVAEAVWVVRYQELGLDFSYEAPLDPLKAMSKDADFRIETDDGPLWLDSVAITIPKSEPNNYPFIVGRSVGISVNVFAKRAKGKYDKKFKDEVENGALKGHRTGILLNLLKAEQELLFPFHVGGLEEVNPGPPNGLFTEDRPGLVCVMVANCVRPAGQEHLTPNVIIKWIRPGLVT